jgi:hypothetical protein
MSRKTRGSLIHPDEVTIVHTVAKTARNLFLLRDGQPRSPSPKIQARCGQKMDRS